MTKMEQKKKPTNLQLQRRLENAVLHIDKTKSTRTVFFADKMLRLTVTDDFAIIETGYHRHVFNAVNPNNGGYARPYIYTQRFIDLALSIGDEITTKDGFSYQKMFEVLHSREDKSDYNLCWFYDIWLNNIFMPLYSIDETAASAFLVYESYLHNVARNAVILSEKTSDLTNLQFIDQVFANIKKYTENLEESVLFPKLTDAELAARESQALEEYETEEANKKLKADNDENS